MTQQPQPLAERVAHALRTAAATGKAEHRAGFPEAVNRHGDSNTNGHRHDTTFALCMGDVAALTAAVLAAVQPEIDELAELKLTPRERANRRVRALLDADDHEAACAAAEAFEASEAYDLTQTRI